MHALGIQEYVMDLTPHRDLLRTIARTDPDPRARHRADGVLLVANGLSWAEAARRFDCAPNSLRNWALRLTADGRQGLVDQPRRGRPPKLDHPAHELLETALAASPLDYDDPVTTWTIADLTDLLARKGWSVCRATVFRTMWALGYRSRRPKHDLTHRQDPEAAAAAKHVLAELQKKGLLPGLDADLSTWMNVKSIPTPTWQKSGSGWDPR
jgi:transposase